MADSRLCACFAAAPSKPIAPGKVVLISRDARVETVSIRAHVSLRMVGSRVHPVVSSPCCPPAKVRPLNECLLLGRRGAAKMGRLAALAAFPSHASFFILSPPTHTLCTVHSTPSYTDGGLRSAMSHSSVGVLLDAISNTCRRWVRKRSLWGGKEWEGVGRGSTIEHTLNGSSRAAKLVLRTAMSAFVASLEAKKEVK